MRILIAPQEFKGSLTAVEAAAAMLAGVERGLPGAGITVLPIADGGPGTLDALVAARHGQIRRVTVSGPLGAAVQARYGLIDETAVIETAEACGLVLLAPDALDPARATTYGAGELVRSALDAGCRRFLLGIGGTATNDGGAGLAQALGFRLLNAKGMEIGQGAAALASLDRIDTGNVDPHLGDCTFDVAVDVQNPLCGPAGATAVYGPQKGVTPEQLPRFDAALARLGDLIERELGRAVKDLPGAGAAGGLGAGLAGFCGARLRPGFEIVADAVDLESRIAAVDLVFTGEGRLDGQTAFGKTVAGVSRLAERHGVPVVALAGGIAPDFAIAAIPGLTAAFALTARPLTLADAEMQAADLLAAVAEHCSRLIYRMGMQS